MSRNAVLETC